MIYIFFILIILIVAAFVWASIEEQRRAQERLRALQIADVDSMTGLEFEHYVCCLLRHQGYSAEVTRASGDFGADILATKGGTKFAFQTKRYSKKVSNKAVNEAYTAKAHYKCGQCAVVTNSFFTAAAQKLANSTGCVLVDRDELASWILEFQGGSASHVGPTVDVNTRPEHDNVHNCDFLNDNGVSVQRSSEKIVQGESDLDPALLSCLRREAETDYPGDYSTQVYVLEEQIAAFKSIQRLQVPDLPTDVLQSIIRAATIDYENDFSTAKYVIDEQVEAYRKMQNICV